MHTDATSITTTLASAPITGYTYRYASYFDFAPENGGTRLFGTGGFSASSSQNMWASIEIPAGARVRDIEWYVYNGGASPAPAIARVWVAGDRFLDNSVADVAIPTGGAISATRVVVADTSNGPYPPGTKLNLGLFTSSDKSVQINGARVGFTGGNAATGLLVSPVRVFDSRSTSKLSSGAKRVITLPTSHVPPGTTGVILSITVLKASAAGSLKVHPGAGGAPAVASSLTYAKRTPTTAQISVLVSADGKLTLNPSKSTHVVVDLIGRIA